MQLITRPGSLCGAVAVCLCYACVVGMGLRFCAVACVVPRLWVLPGVVGRPWVCFPVVWWVGQLSLALLCALVDIEFKSIFGTFTFS